MASGVGDGRVAIYWDFDNLACSGRGGPADVGAIAGYAATFGTVVISRAYANWVRHTAYQDVLHTNAVDLVQLFEVANTKNGADIRIAADAVSDRFLHRDLTHVMVVSSDSDFTGLARRLREMGAIVIGIGTQAATRAWRFSCNDFKYYNDLLSGRVSHPGTVSAKELAGARSLLVRAAGQLFSSVGEEEIPQARLMSMMKRLDPGFDPAGVGFRTFTAFVDEVGRGTVSRLPHTSAGDHRLRYTGDL